MVPFLEKEFSPFLEKALLCTIHRILLIIPTYTVHFFLKTTRIGNLSQFKCQGLKTSSKEQDALLFLVKKDFMQNASWKSSNCSKVNVPSIFKRAPGFETPFICGIQFPKFLHSLPLFCLTKKACENVIPHRKVYNTTSLGIF